MMLFSKRASLLALGLVLMLIISACGGGTTSTGSTQNTPVPTPTTPPSTVKTAQATVGGQTTTILTNAQGMTLYYFIPDTVAKSACTAACAKAWPPLLATGSTTPTSATSLPGQLSVLNDDNGGQVTYSGYLLYTFAADKAPGDTKGEGIGNKWYVATPDLASVTVRLSIATVKGKSETILTNTQNMTLYYFTPDTSTKSACTGGCAQNWPPLLSTGSGSPTADAPIKATLTAFNDANGNQVECNGHLLYTFAADKAPGDVNGEGVGGKWFVATPDLATL